MKTKLIALMLCLSLVAGCGAASSSKAEDSPSYTYVNSDPSMVLVTSPGGDITYENYRLYLDVNEQMSRMAARQNMGVCAALEKDFPGMGIEINEDDFKSMASQQLLSAMMYTPSFAENLEQISEAAGMTQEEVSEAMMLSFRSQYLIQLLGEHYQKLAEDEMAQSEAPSAPETSSEVASTSSETDSGNGTTSEQSPEEAEAIRQQAVYDRASAMMQEYSSDYETRLSFDDDSALVTIDGQAVASTDEINHFLDYAGIANRIDAAAFIQAGELALRELERRNTEFDRTNFEETLKEYVDGIRGDEGSMKQLEKICGKFSATVDDYFKVLERPIWLQEVGDLYYIAMTEEFGTLTADSGELPDSADSYYVQELAKLLEGSEIVNVTGK